MPRVELSPNEEIVRECYSYLYNGSEQQFGRLYLTTNRLVFHKIRWMAFFTRIILFALCIPVVCLVSIIYIDSIVMLLMVLGMSAITIIILAERLIKACGSLLFFIPLKSIAGSAMKKKKSGKIVMEVEVIDNGNYSLSVSSLSWDKSIRKTLLSEYGAILS
jgi:hypothetical protein